MGFVKATFRNFANNKIATIIKVAGLSISASAAILIWAFIIKENSYDKGIDPAGRIFRLDAQWASMPPFIGHLINQNLGSEIVTARLNFLPDIGIQAENKPSNLPELLFADSTFFRIIPLEFIAGNRKNSLELPFSIVLSESTALKLFGTIDALGKIIKLEDQLDFTVTGITKDNPYMHFNAETIASISSFETIKGKGSLTAYDGWSYPTYIMLPNGSEKSRYEKSIQELLKKFGYNQNNQNFHLKPFNDIYYSAEYENESNTRHGNLLYNRILIAVSVFILILAAINFINLTIAGALSRSKEVLLRRVHGATGPQLAGRFLLETTLLIIISIILSFALLWFLNPILYRITEFSVNARVFITPHNILILLSGILMFILLAGIYPAIYISTGSFSRIGKKGSLRRLTVRNALIIFQNLVAVVLICCTLIVNNQFHFMNRKDLGFNKNNVVVLRINSVLKNHLELLRQKLTANPEIASVSFSSRIPGNYWGSWCCVKVDGTDGKENKYFNNYVDPFYLDLMGIRLKAGRNFSADEGDSKTTYLINETAIQLYGLENPVGKIISSGNSVMGEIIGIINDFHYRGLMYEHTPLLLFNTPDYKNYVNIKLASGNPENAILKIREAWSEICPAFMFDYKFLDATYDLQYSAERKFEKLLFSFSLLALFIASIGLLGISFFSTERRIKEIGIRKVNGATSLEIISMLNKDILPWLALAFVAACPFATWIMTGWLQKFPFRSEIGIFIFVVAGIISSGLAVLTITLQSGRAATRNPVETLRYE